MPMKIQDNQSVWLGIQILPEQDIHREAQEDVVTFYLAPQSMGTCSLPRSSLNESLQSLLNFLPRPGPSRPMMTEEPFIVYMPFALDNIITSILALKIAKSTLDGPVCFSLPCGHDCVTSL